MTFHMREKTYTCLLSCSGVKDYCLPKERGAVLIIWFGDEFQNPICTLVIWETKENEIIGRNF